MNLLKRVAIDPEIPGGKPCIRGTRITIFDVHEYLAGGRVGNDPGSLAAYLASGGYTALGRAFDLGTGATGFVKGA